MVEVVKLVQAQVDESIIITFIENSKVAYQPTADEILYLKDLGASSKVTAALLSKGQGATVPRVEPTPIQVDTKPVQTTPSTVVAETPSTAVIYSETDYALDSTTPTTVVREGTTVRLESQANIAAAFQKDLNAYGQWYTIEDYGRCWRPYVAQNNPLWRPYCDRGRWVYTDCGWYWVSEYPWGAITFHYGRWFQHGRLGWLWWPHRQWGPSWVVWRRTSLYGGWAPLPPFTAVDSSLGLVHHRRAVDPEYDFDLRPSDYVFAPFRYFVEPNIADNCVSTRETRNLYAQSIPLHRYYVRSDGVVVNEGFSREQVALHTRSGVKMLSIRDYEEDVDYPRSEQILQDAGVAVIYRPYHPLFPGPRPPRRPFLGDPGRLPPPGIGAPRPAPIAPQARPAPGPSRPGPMYQPSGPGGNRPTGPGMSPSGPSGPGGSRPPATSPGGSRPSGPSSGPGYSNPGGGGQSGPGGSRPPATSPGGSRPSGPSSGPGYSNPGGGQSGPGGSRPPATSPGGSRPSGPSSGPGYSNPGGGGQSGPGSGQSGPGGGQSRPGGGQSRPGGGQGGPGGGSGGPPRR